MKNVAYFFSLSIIMIFLPTQVEAQDQDSLREEIKELQDKLGNLRHSFDRLQKGIDDLLFFERLGDIAYIDKVAHTGPPARVVKNPTGQGAKNPLTIRSYVFIPKDMDPSGKYPLLVLPHGGVHSNFNTFYTHILRELMYQKYIVVAPEYRGSTGYGKGFYEKIDYGGLEIQDTKASRDYMVENYEIVDSNRIGIFGWSHGGLHTLMNIFEYPQSYKVAYAGVPVSDLIARMGYKTQRYRDLYEAEYHIGKSAYEDVEEYRKRSPAWQAHKLQTPLLIHSNTNDGDVNVFEVEHLIKSLKAADKKFEYEIYEDIPGGHSFDRIDTLHAKGVRLKIYQFLARYLRPERGFNSVQELHRAGYRY